MERTRSRVTGHSFFRLAYGVIGKPDPMYMTLATGVSDTNQTNGRRGLREGEAEVLHLNR
jgi:hypothetical protein